MNASRRKRELQKLLPDGWTLGIDGRSHYVALRPDGSKARHPDGRPITFALSPSCWRTDKNDLAALKRAGLG